MWNIFQRKPVELLSFHLPKTAGTSFGKLLNEHYKKRLLLVYAPSAMQQLELGKLPSIKRGTLAVHGHMISWETWRDQFPVAKRVCWIRDPLDRLASLYNFWNQNPEVVGQVKKRFDEIRPSFQEFILNPDFEKPVFAYQRYLGKVPASFFHFIGEMELFNTDVHRFSKLMQIPSKVYTSNKTQAATPLNYEYEVVRKHLTKEFEIYNSLKDAADIARRQFLSQNR